MKMYQIIILMLLLVATGVCHALIIITGEPTPNIIWAAYGVGGVGGAILVLGRIGIIGNPNEPTEEDSDQ